MTQVTRARSYTVPVGTPRVVDMAPFGHESTITARPGGGGTLQIEYSTTPRAAGDAAAAAWQNWPLGTVAAIISDSLISPITAVRATAATADGILEIVG